MSWLVGYVIASMVVAFVVVRIFEYLVTGASGGVVNIAKLILFVGVWTAITMASGMRAFTGRIRYLRKAIAQRGKL